MDWQRRTHRLVRLGDDGLSHRGHEMGDRYHFLRQPDFPGIPEYLRPESEDISGAAQSDAIYGIGRTRFDLRHKNRPDKRLSDYVGNAPISRNDGMGTIVPRRAEKCLAGVA